MKIPFFRSLADLYRLTNNPQALLKVFSIWAVVTFLGVGAFGIYPQIRLLVQNIQLYPLLKTTNQGLTAKVNDINTEYSKIENNNKKVLLLDTFLPDKADIHKYLLDLSFAAGKCGFQLGRLSAEGASGQGTGSITLQASFSGTGDVTALVDAVESLKRVTKVEEVHVTPDHGETSVVMGISIFVLEDQ